MLAALERAPTVANAAQLVVRGEQMIEYDRADAAYYDYYSLGVPGDIAFYVEEAQRAGPPVLELGCGTGRTLIPIAKAGIEIMGLDRAPSMLAIARHKIAALDQSTRSRIRIVAGDMRELSLPDKYSLITIPFRAFLHLLTQEDQRQTLHRVREHLTDGGRLVFNIFDPRIDIIAAHEGDLGAAMKKVSEFVNPASGNRVVAWDTRQYDLQRQVLEQYYIFEELEDGQVVSKTYSPLTLRMVYRYEMQYLLELCGFRIEALYGSFGRGPFRYGGEQIWVAGKA